jgi:hypothetical protein
MSTETAYRAVLVYQQNSESGNLETAILDLLDDLLRLSEEYAIEQEAAEVIEARASRA